ncbi:hypothetical protein Tco_0528985 [Tanacetum coccineum]
MNSIPPQGHTKDKEKMRWLSDAVQFEEPRAANHDDDGTDLAELLRENAEFHRDNDDRRRHSAVGTGFQGGNPKFYGSLKPKEFIDWLSQVEEILDFKEVPEERRVSLVMIRLHGQSQAWAAFLPYNFERDLYQQFQNLRQGSRSVDEYSIEFYTFLARVDLNESPIQLLAWRGTGSFRQPANSTSGTSSLSQPARETSAQPTPQPARGSVAPLQGRTGGLRCFNCGEVGHRQVDYQNLKSSNRGLFTEANESKFVLIIYSTQTYDDYADTDEEYVSGDVGPLFLNKVSSTEPHPKPIAIHCIVKVAEVTITDKEYII